MSDPFHFYTQAHLIKLLKNKASDLQELLEGIKTVPGSSIYYHTHQFLQQHLYLTTAPPNDFAYWISNILNLAQLGERVTSIDIIHLKSIENIRGELITTISEYLEKEPYIPTCLDCHEFYFESCMTFVVPTKYEVTTKKEFLEALEKISVNSIYFHIFEAPRRLQRDENDFSAWFRHIGQEMVAEKLSQIDPYALTLEGLRKKIHSVVVKYGKD